MNVISNCASVLAEENPALAGDVKVLSNAFPPLPTPFLIHVAIFLAIDLNNMFRQRWKYFRLILQWQQDLCIWKGHFSGKSHHGWLGTILPKKGRSALSCLMSSARLSGCRRTKVAQEQRKHTLRLCPSPS